MNYIFIFLMICSQLFGDVYFRGGAASWKDSVDVVGSLPTSGNTAGDCRAVQNTGTSYCWTGSAWVAGGGGGGGGITSINGDTTAAQIITSGTSGTNVAVSTSAGTTTVNIPTASASNTGKISSTDWSTFNAKEPAVTKGNLTDAGTDGITVTNGGSSVIGSGTSLSQHVADTTHNGYLSSTDWNTFNGKGGFPTIVNISSNVTLTSNARHYVNTSSARSLTLPAVASSQCLWLKDVTGTANTNNITIVRDGSNKIENVSASYVYQTSYGGFKLCPDGTNWWIE